MCRDNSSWCTTIANMLPSSVSMVVQYKTGWLVASRVIFHWRCISMRPGDLTHALVIASLQRPTFLALSLHRFLCGILYRKLCRSAWHWRVQKVGMCRNANITDVAYKFGDYVYLLYIFYYLHNTKLQYREVGIFKNVQCWTHGLGGECIDDELYRVAADPPWPLDVCIGSGSQSGVGLGPVGMLTAF